MSVVLEFPEAPQFEFLIDLQGQSLYQKWLQLGNVGTESDFLNWLKLDGDTLYEPKITTKGTAFNKNFGTTAGTVTQGNDSRLSDSRNPTSGSSNYIQNQNASAQSANMWISGSGSFGGSVDIGTTDATSVIKAGGANTNMTLKAMGFNGSISFMAGGVANGNVSTREVLNLNGTTGASTFVSSVTATNYITSSDETLKDIISTDGDVIRYKWKNKQDDLIHIGYSAQEKRVQYPDSVHENEKGLLSVSYVEILVDKVRKLEKRINELENK